MPSVSLSWSVGPLSSSPDHYFEFIVEGEGSSNCLATFLAQLTYKCVAKLSD